MNRKADKNYSKNITRKYADTCLFLIVINTFTICIIYSLDNILKLRMLYKNNENINLNENKKINSKEFYYDLNDKNKPPYSSKTLALFSFFNRNNSYFC